jgi:hypothetical protein
MKQLFTIALLMTISLHAMEKPALDTAIFKDFIKKIHATDVEGVKGVLAKYPEAAKAIGEYEYTALHWAVNPHMSPAYNKEYVEEIIDLLITAGADIEARNSHLFTPLGLAAREENDEGVAALVKHRAQIHVWDNSSVMIPLGNAVDYKRLSMVKLLLMAGASREALSFDFKDDKGNRFTFGQYLQASTTTDEIKQWLQDFQGPALRWRDAYRQSHKSFKYGAEVATMIVDPRPEQEERRLNQKFCFFDPESEGRE